MEATTKTAVQHPTHAVKNKAVVNLLAIVEEDIWFARIAQPAVGQNLILRLGKNVVTLKVTSSNTLALYVFICIHFSTY